MAPSAVTTVARTKVTVNMTTESLQLVRCLLRVSVFHVAFLRGLFPEKNFKTVEMHNLDGLCISMLTPSTPAAQALVHWVDVGVADALAKGYLASMQFGIAATPDCSQLIETYTYKFSYADDASVSGIDLVGGGAAAGKEASTGRMASPARPAARATLATVKAGVVTLVRSLIQLCQTLAPVPAQHHLFVKLTYREGVTPAEYEPPGFAPAPDAVHRAVFASKPFTFDAGCVHTRAHAVSVGLASTLDAMTVGGLGGGSQPVPAASGGCESLSMLLSEQQPAAPGKAGKARCGSGGVTAAGAALAGLGLAAVAEAADEEMVSSQQQPSSKAAAAVEPAALVAATAAVRGHCFAAAAAAAERAGTRTKGRGGCARAGGAAAVEYADLVVRFPDVPIPTLDAALAGLVDGGDLATADGGKAYIVVGCGPGGKAAAAAAAPKSCLGGIASGGAGSDGRASQRSVGAPAKAGASADGAPPKKRAKTSMVTQPGGGGGGGGGGARGRSRLRK